MNIFLTGGNGLIGKRVSILLEKRGHNVISFDKSIENNASFGERLVFIITICLKYLILLAGIVLLILLLPIIPFLWVSYKGFHGKYGIIKLFRENFNVYQL